MNKTVTANISGIIFNIEEEAYQKLSQYLTTIRNYFKDSEGDDEIMADIEARIAELFQERLTDAKQVVTMKDIEEVFEIMGQPEQYMDEDGEPVSGDSEAAEAKRSGPRRIFRDEENGIIGGVCAGVSAHFGWDPIWMRIFFGLLFFSFGSGILLYIFLWIVIPSAKTTAEKLEMKGEKVNIENIGSHIKENFGGEEGAKKAKGAANSFFNSLGEFLGKFFAVFGRVIGIAFIGAGIFMAYALIMFWIGSDMIFSFSEDGMNSMNFEQFIQATFPGEDYLFWAHVGVSIVLGVPILAFIYTGVKLVLDIRKSYKGVAITFISLWILGLMICGFVALNTVKNFSHDEDITSEFKIDQPTSDTLYLAAATDPYFSDHYDHSDNELELIRVEEKQIIFGDPELDIRPSYDTLYHVEVTVEACGTTSGDAYDRAENIIYHIERNDSLLTFDPYFISPTDDQWRCQEVNVTVYVPEGKAIYLDESADRIIYNIWNVHYMDDRRMSGHTWLMTEDGLECTDCGL